MRPAVGALLFAIVAPGSVAGLVPWLLSGWKVGDPLLGWTAVRWIGVVCFLLGAPLLADAFVRFVREGRGTPAPIMPTERLVVNGPYRYVRNPMYIAVLAMVVGQGLFFGSTAVLIYAACVGVAFHVFVLAYEEPTLRRRYGAEYDDYAREVHRWRPRLVPWSPRR